MQNYLFEEKEQSFKNQQKYETLLCLGNGYLGMRSAYCEEYAGQMRTTMIAGLYDQQPNETEELAPVPDASVLQLSMNGVPVGPLNEKARDYVRTLDVRNGLLTYTYTAEGCQVIQRRFASMENRHLVAFETVIQAGTVGELSVGSFINARGTIDGTQHIFEDERIVLEGDTLWYAGHTAVSSRQFRVASRMKLFLNGEEQTGLQRYSTLRRLVGSSAKLELKEGDELRILRYALYYTENDPEWTQEIKEHILKEMAAVAGTSFEDQLKKSAAVWQEKWNCCDIRIHCADPMETLKTRMALYHMMIMCPAGDHRVSIAAKGLTGPGYAGHVFWDCEIFNLPFFVYTDPAVARDLCIYRHHTLGGARAKAEKYGYEGAMYPWESASTEGAEQSPTLGNYFPDNRLRYVSCGDIEHHVVCGVAYGNYHYAKWTGDQAYMNEYGYEILFSTADFWQSRLEYRAEKDRYEILQVTGPDEYKVYIDNDVYTNYLVHWNLKTALYEAEKLKEKEPALYTALNEKLGLDTMTEKIREKLPKLYLPVANEAGIIPQNDTYLQLKEIDLTKYKESGINRHIYRDYSLDEISGLMVSKQADLIQLFALMPSLVSKETVMKNFAFYNEKCLHDSSLSLSAFAIVAAQIRKGDLAHTFFRGALDTDFGEKAANSAAGIHAANCGGIWQCIAFGFAGIRIEDGVLTVDPALPEAWAALELNLFRNGAVHLKIDHTSVQVTYDGKEPLAMKICGKEYTISFAVSVSY